MGGGLRASRAIAAHGHAGRCRRRGDVSNQSDICDRARPYSRRWTDAVVGVVLSSTTGVLPPPLSGAKDTDRSLSEVFVKTRRLRSGCQVLGVAERGKKAAANPPAAGRPP